MENFSLELCQDRHGPLNRRANIFFFPLFSHGLLLFNVQSFISFVSLCYLPFVVVFFPNNFFYRSETNKQNDNPLFFAHLLIQTKKNREENDDKFSLWTLSARSVDTTGGLSLQSTRTFSNTHKKERNIMIIKNNDNNKKKREPNERKKKKNVLPGKKVFSAGTCQQFP